MEETLAVVSNDNEADKVIRLYEGFVSATGPVRLADIIEDELLLRIPMIPRHEREDACRVTNGPPSVTESTSKQGRPFAVLARLKTPKD